VSKSEPTETSTFQTASDPSTNNGTPAANGVGHATHNESKNKDSSYRKREASGSTDDADPDFSDVMTPSPKKKHKKTLSTDNDAAIARRLQEMENARARSTRGGGTKRKPLAKKDKKVKKSKTKVASDDDSDAEGGSGSKKEVNRNSGFHVSSSFRSRKYDPDRPIPTIEPDESTNPRFCWSQADQTNRRVQPKWRMAHPGIGYGGSAKQSPSWRNSGTAFEPPKFVKKRSLTGGTLEADDPVTESGRTSG